ncbi:glucose-6-phosphate isomerase [bacterium]|nr:glucose-6-phosphate isomerase [bacterium]
MKPIDLTIPDEFRSRIEAGTAFYLKNRIVDRIWKKDHTVWKDSPVEIANRLGWLNSPDWISGRLGEIGEFVRNVRNEGFEKTILLGMGGSSLAPEVFRKTLGLKKGYPDLEILDSTDPDAVRRAEKKMDLRRTLFLVSTKSGGTVETFSLFRYFYNRMLDSVGKAQTGRHFAAVTDPGSGLERLAEGLDFRKIFLNDPDIGGRFSALSFFGMVSAGLIGADLQDLIRTAGSMAESCGPGTPADRNPGVRIGILLGELAKSKRNKLTFLLPPSLSAFGDWVEQLVAESTGKEGRGIVPVVHEIPPKSGLYGEDRVFVHMDFNSKRDVQERIYGLKSMHPVIEIHLDEPADLGGLYFIWEMAVAVAGERMKINPFDQPDVESAKQQARQAVDQYRASGFLPEITASPAAGKSILDFLRNPAKGAYIGLQAFFEATEERKESLGLLATRLRDRTGLAVTTGFGPRFLHSTGQLHKGDSGCGLFIQFTSDPENDLPIPDEVGRPDSSISFQVLLKAQAAGDYLALKQAGRNIVRIHLEGDPAAVLNRIRAEC